MSKNLQLPYSMQDSLMSVDSRFSTTPSSFCVVAGDQYSGCATVLPLRLTDDCRAAVSGRYMKTHGKKNPQRNVVLAAEGSPARTDRVVAMQARLEGGDKEVAEVRRNKGRQRTQHARVMGTAGIAGSSPRPLQSPVASEKTAVRRTRSSPKRNGAHASGRQPSARRKGKLRESAATKTNTTGSDARMVHTAALAEALAIMASEEAAAAAAALSPRERMNASTFEARWQDKLQKIAGDLGDDRYYRHLVEAQEVVSEMDGRDGSTNDVSERTPPDLGAL